MGNVMGSSSKASTTQLALLRHRSESLVPEDRKHLRQLFSSFKSPGVNPADYDVLEEIFHAALRAGDLELAQQVRDVVLKRFPVVDFIRSGRMQLLLEEARGGYSNADQGIKALLKASEDADVGVRKRQAVLAVAQGRRTEAIDVLNKYVDTFSTDIEAWNELCALYLDEQMYAQAQFCAEEVILLDPYFHQYHIRLAEILYTRGDLASAVKYYCRALELCPDTIRALYGLKIATSKLLKDTSSAVTTSPASKKGSGADPVTEDREKWTDLQSIVVQRLTALYGKSAGASTETAKKWLSK